MMFGRPYADESKDPIVPTSLTIERNSDSKRARKSTMTNQSSNSLLARVESMYQFQLGLYSNGYPRPMLFAEMFYPTTIVPVPTNFPIYHRSLSRLEQNSPTDLSTHAEQISNNHSKCGVGDYKTSEKSINSTLGKKLNFGIDNILDKTTEENSAPNARDRSQNLTKENPTNSATSANKDEKSDLRLPIITSESCASRIVDNRLHPVAYPYSVNHFGAMGAFSFPSPRYNAQSEYQGFQLLASHDQRIGRHQSTPKRKRSWSRAVFSALQRKGLEKRFEVQKYVTKPDRRQLAAMLGLTDAQVKVWFQNRRMKWRHVEEQKKKRTQEEERRKRGLVQTKDLCSEPASSDNSEFFDYDSQKNKDIVDEINVDECGEGNDGETAGDL